MNVRLPTYVVILLVLVGLPFAACNRSTPGLTSPDANTNLKVALMTEPQSLRPEFLRDSPCPTHPPFGVRLTVIVGGDDLIVRNVRFGFLDRSGVRRTPEVFATQEGVASIPTSPPIPFGSSTLPNASPIPIPNASPITGVLLSQGRRLALPFFLRLPCGVLSEGSVIVSVDGADTIGRLNTTELRVPVQ